MTFVNWGVTLGSVNRRLWMNCLAIRLAAVVVIKRPTFCSTVWLNKSLSTPIRLSLINVSCIPQPRRMLVYWNIYWPRFMTPSIDFYPTDREAVEKRLFVLQQRGFIHAYDTSWPAKGFIHFWSLIFPHLDVVVLKKIVILPRPLKKEEKDIWEQKGKTTSSFIFPPVQWKYYVLSICILVIVTSNYYELYKKKSKKKSPAFMFRF